MSASHTRELHARVDEDLTLEQIDAKITEAQAKLKSLRDQHGPSNGNAAVSMAENALNGWLEYRMLKMDRTSGGGDE